jgi:hypothetical protein
VQRWIHVLLRFLPARRNKDDSATGSDTGPSDADSDWLVDDGDCEDSPGALFSGQSGAIGPDLLR